MHVRLRLERERVRGSLISPLLPLLSSPLTSSAQAAVVRKPIVANDLIHAVRDAVMPNLIRAVLSNLR